MVSPSWKPAALRATHLGSRASALLDGQLAAEDEERAWAHVESCDECRHRLERERWIKSRLACLSHEPAASSAPASLKGSLLGAVPEREPFGGAAAMDVMVFALVRQEHRARRNAGLAALGGTALGAAVMGVITLAAAPVSEPPAAVSPNSVSRAVTVANRVREVAPRVAPGVPTNVNAALIRRFQR